MLKVNALTTISISSNTTFCKKMAEEEKCSQNVTNYNDLNYSCIDQNGNDQLSEHIRIAVHCSVQVESLLSPEQKTADLLTSSVCYSQNATSRNDISIKQCYHSAFLTDKT